MADSMTRWSSWPAGVGRTRRTRRSRWSTVTSTRPGSWRVATNSPRACLVSPTRAARSVTRRPSAGVSDSSRSCDGRSCRLATGSRPACACPACTVWPTWATTAWPCGWRTSAPWTAAGTRPGSPGPLAPWAGSPAAAPWGHSLVARAVDDRLRADLRTLGARVPELLDGMDALPQALPHGDASPQNLLVPADDPDTFVAIGERATLTRVVADLALALPPA